MASSTSNTRRNQFLLLLVVILTCLDSSTDVHCQPADNGPACWMAATGKDGQCRRLHACPEHARALRGLQGAARSRYLRRLQVDDCIRHHPRFFRWTMFCCPLDGDVAPAVSSRLNVTNNAVGAGILPKNCGQRVFGGVTKVINGQPAVKNSWPWIAVLGRKIRKNDKFRALCGGALITHRHVVTAGHCFTGSSLESSAGGINTVRLGEHDLDNDTESAHQDFRIQKLIKHEDYQENPILNDIALLLLKGKVEFSEIITPICLPLDQKLRKRTFLRFTVMAAGWGHTTIETFDLASILQEVPLRVQPWEDCRGAFAGFRNIILDEDRTLCVGSASSDKHQDTCQGDSGGPLVFRRIRPPYRRYLIGIVSAGISQCGQPGKPAIYVRVTEYVDWILSHLTDE